MSYDSYLAHHGILGMKWGVRRYQNADGSLTEAGKKRAEKDAARADRKQKKIDRRSIRKAFNTATNADYKLNRYAGKYLKYAHKYSKTDNEKRKARLEAKAHKVVEKIEKNKNIYDKAVDSIKPIHTRQGERFIKDILARSAYDSSFDEYYDGVYYYRRFNQKKFDVNAQRARDMYDLSAPIKQR